jgi:hypothetical protein
MTLICGTNSDRSSNRFDIRSLEIMLKPVMLPPGRAKLGTKPLSTGSLPVIKTTGIAEFAIITARIETSPLTAAITSTLQRIRSAANTGSRSNWPSAQRYLKVIGRAERYGSGILRSRL